MKFPGFIGPSYSGQSRSTDAERTINLFLEQVESGQGKDPTEYSFVKSPGLEQFTSFGGIGGAVSNIRGLLPVGQQLYGVAGQFFFTLTSGAAVTFTAGGILPDDGTPVSIVAGTKVGTTQQFLVGTQSGAYMVNPNTSPFVFPITQFGGVGAVSSVGFIDQFGLFLDRFNGAGFYFSEPGDFTTGSSLNFISAEANANTYVQLLVDRRRNIWLFGNQITQIFYDNAANDPTNPFLPNLSAGLPYGTIALNSPIDWGGRVGWLTRDFNGQGIFVATDGGLVPHRVSNRAVEYQWSTYATMADAETYSITIKGHDFMRIRFPSADTTWEYDPATGDWHEVLFWDSRTGTYHAHLVHTAAAAFGTIIGGSRRDGNLYTISLDNQDDDLGVTGDRIRWLRRAPIITNENKLAGYPWFELDMSTGGGDGSNLDPTAGPVTPEANPLVDLRVSNDWGNTFGASRSRSSGTQANYNTRVVWTRCGMGRQRVFEISGNAAVKTVINAAYLRTPDARTT